MRNASHSCVRLESRLLRAGRFSASPLSPVGRQAGVDRQRVRGRRSQVSWDHRELELATCDELIFIAFKHVTAGDEGKAREALSKLTDHYLDYHLVERAMKSEELALAVARLILAFQITDFKLLRPTSTPRN